MYFYCLLKHISEVKLKHAKYSFKIYPLKCNIWKVSKALIFTKPLVWETLCTFIHREEGRLQQGSFKKTLFYFMVYVLLCVREEMRYRISRNEMCKVYEQTQGVNQTFHANVYCREIKCGFKKDLLIGLEGNKRKNEALPFVNLMRNTLFSIVEEKKNLLFLKYCH